MATMNQIVRLAVDTYNGKPANGYSLDQSESVLHKALIEANHGKNYLDRKDIRDGKCGELFAIIEESVVKTVIEGFQGNEFFMELVDYRNLRLGDTSEFYIPDDSLYFVDSVARGTQGLRRQRITGGSSISVKMNTYGVKVFDEIDRILSQRSDMTEMISRVGESIAYKQYEDIYKKWTSVINNSNVTYFPVAGSYSEDALLTLCEHIEAATGRVPVIMGTRAALRKITTAVLSDSAKEDLYNIGYYGKFNGIPMVRIKQMHKINTDDFIMPNDKLFVMAIDSKPIKYVNEGEALIVPPSFGMNADLSEDYLFVNNAGVEVVLPDKQFGVYTIA